MSCSPFDLRDYFLKELAEPEVLAVEAHVRQCPACREEVDRLRVTECALLAIRDEEIPQRIAFVSDKIFEPSPWQRWWAGFWGSAARLGFASSAMLSAAILVYALRPAPAGQGLTALPAASTVQTVSESEIQGRIDTAVTRAVADLETRQAGRTRQLVLEMNKRSEEERYLRAAMEAENYYLQRRSRTLLVSSSGYGAPRAERMAESVGEESK
jgi:anti-sigma factor RsiW